MACVCYGWPDEATFGSQKCLDHGFGIRSDLVERTPCWFGEQVGKKNAKVGQKCGHVAGGYDSMVLSTMDWYTAV